MANEKLQIFAAELARIVKDNAGPDWWRHENVRTKLRIEFKKILARFG